MILFNVWTDTFVLLFIQNHKQLKMKTTILTIALFVFTLSINAQLVPKPLECKTPQSISATPVSDKSAVIIWSGETDNDVFIVSYRISDSDNWNKISNASPGILLNNLQACKEYEYKITAICNGTMSESSVTKSFITSGCEVTAMCELRKLNGYTTNITKTSAFLIWDLIPGVSYRFSYRESSDDIWKQYKTKLNYLILFGLNECTGYQWYIDVICANGTISNSNTINDFKTTNCAKIISAGNLQKSIEEVSYSLYPNPAQNFITISSKDETQILIESQILIFDFYGRLVKNVEIFTGQTAINIEDLHTGMYLVKIINKNKTVQYSFKKS